MESTENQLARFISTNGNGRIRISDNSDDLYVGTASGVGFIGPETSATGNNIQLDFATGNTTISGDLSATNIAGTLTTAAQPNINSVGNILVNQGTTSTAFIELGSGRTVDGTSFIDLIGDTTFTDYGLRVARNSGATGGALITSRGTGVLNIQTEGAGSLNLNTNGTNGLIVDGATQDVSIPNGNLSVTGTGTLGATASARVVLGTTVAGGEKGLAIFYDTVNDVASLEAIEQGVAFKNIALQKSGGNVYIGKETGSSLLELDAQSNDGIRINNGTVNGVVFNTSDNSMTVGTVSAHPLLFFANNTEAARIDTSGNMGIGTTSPDSPLNVLGGTTIGSNQI